MRVTLKDFFELIKIRILIPALLTTFFGYAVSLDSSFWDLLDLMWLLIGSFFVFSASAMLNHALEVDTDSLMKRTQFRPLPTKRVSFNFVLILIVLFIIVGSFILYFKTNMLVLINSLGIFFLYNFVYTPIKKLSSLNTFIGGFPGAMPLLSGWFMVEDSINMFILLLFVMLYFWQLPHFFAIAWIYRDSYKAAHLKMISLNDTGGLRTRFYLVISTFLFIFSLYLPLLYGSLGGIYTVSVTLLNIALLYYVGKFCMDLSDMIARKVLLVTVFYPLFIPVSYIIGLVS